MNEYSTNNSNDLKMWDIFKHKEEYRREKLEEVKKYFMDNGYYSESKELEMYIELMEQNEDEDYNTIITRNNNTYIGSKSKIWTNYLKIICYIQWIIDILLFILIGGIFYEKNPLIGVFLGALIGFVIGFMVIAITMTFVTMCENIAITTDNTAKILIGIDEIKEHYNISDR